MRRGVTGCPRRGGRWLQGATEGEASPLQQKANISIFRLATKKVADIDTKTKWLAKWVGLGTLTARKAVALEAERFGGPKGKNESKNRM